MTELRNTDKVVFDPLTHTYWAGDKELVGVTTLMRKHGLAPDYSGIPEDVLRHAADRGTAVHRTLEDYDDDKAVAEPYAFVNGDGESVAFDTSKELAAYRELHLPVILSEYLVTDGVTVASSIDKVLFTGEKMVVDLADIKTTSTLHVAALEWQLSIYAWLFELQNPGWRVGRLYGVHVRGDRAKAVEVRRRPDGEIERLVECEREGTEFVPDGIPELTDAIAPQEAASLARYETLIADLVSQLKELQGLVAERRDAVRSYMMGRGISEMACEGGAYTLTRPALRTAIDCKRLKAEMPEVYGKYSKRTEVKGRITFKTR